MLNKLLKRCMPWMDKGRWYHVRTEGNIVTHDSIFSRYEVTQGQQPSIKLYFADPAPKKTIIDVKVISRPSGVDHYVMLDVYSGINDIEYIEGTGYVLTLSPATGVVDYWFFMR